MSQTVRYGDILAAHSLPPAEQQRLDELEPKIAAFKSAWVEAGDALKVIRDLRLYRVGYATFEEYCQDRWGFTTGRARQLIAGVSSATGRSAPSEWAARQLMAAEKRSAGRDLAEEMAEWVEARPPGEVKAAQMPEGVRVSRVSSFLMSPGHRELKLGRIPVSGTLNRREAALILANLDREEARVQEMFSDLRAQIKKLTERAVAAPPVPPVPPA